MLSPSVLIDEIDDLYCGPSANAEDVQCRNVMTYDAGGSLYTLSVDGHLKLRDIRHELLQRRNAQGEQRSSKAATRQLRLLPDLDYNIDDICISSSGKFAAVCGSHRNDIDQAGIALVDLGSGPAKQEKQPHNWAALDEEHFRSLPGLLVLQMAWHPGSSTNLAVLTSDQAWQLYNVDNLSMPEQRFQLQWQTSRSFGVNAEGGRRAVAFAFGPQHGWQRFTVYFLCADGAVFALCPVAPFGAAVPSSAVQSLAEAADASKDLAHSPTTEAWLQQALSGPVSQSSAPVSASVHVQQHALEDHAPCMQGPLRITSAEGSTESLLSLAQSGDTGVGMCALRCGGATTALLVVMSSGLLGAAIVAGDISPQWAEVEPSCVTEGTQLKAVRSECLLGNGQDSTPLLLLDLIDLQAQQPAWDSRDMEESRAPFVLLPDPTVPERVFVRSASAAWSVCLTWLPALSSRMSEDQESLQDVLQLPAPAVEQLLSTKPGMVIVGACPVGDALMGTALMAATSDGKLRCLWPSGARTSETDERAVSVSGISDTASAEVEQMYGALLHGPQKLCSTEGMGLPLRTPQGIRALSEAIHCLLEGHVEYIHQAHHHLLPRLKELKEAGAGQKADLQGLQDMCSALTQDQEDLRASIDRAEKLHGNLQSRLRILADLHWKLPRPLTAAEQQLRDVTLPGLEASVAKLQSTVQGSRRSLRAHTSEQQCPTAPSSLSTASPAISHVQLRRTRAAVAEQAALTSSAKQALQQMQQWLQSHQDSSYA